MNNRLPGAAKASHGDGERTPGSRQEVRYVLYESIGGHYKYPVLCKSEGSAVTPLVRLVPVRGLEAEAVELLSRIIIRVREG